MSSSVVAAWEFYAPKKGWRVYVEDVLGDYQYSGTSWAAAGSGSGGGGTTFRPVTPLSIVSGAVNIDLSLG